MSANGMWSTRDSPLIQELLAEVGHKYILIALEARFDAVPPHVIEALRRIVDEDRLLELVGFAAVCPDLASFHARLGP